MRLPRLGPHPLWMILGYGLVIVALMTIANGLFKQEAMGYRAGVLTGVLIVLAGAAWALERGLRGVSAAPEGTRSKWIVLAVAMALVTVGAAAAILYQPIG